MTCRILGISLFSVIILISSTYGENTEDLQLNLENKIKLGLNVSYYNKSFEYINSSYSGYGLNLDVSIFYTNSFAIGTVFEVEKMKVEGENKNSWSVGPIISFYLTEKDKFHKHERGIIPAFKVMTTFGNYNDKSEISIVIMGGLMVMKSPQGGVEFTAGYSYDIISAYETTTESTTFKIGVGYNFIL